MNFKVRCTSNKMSKREFTVGKIYEAKNGGFIDNSGYKFTAWSDDGASFDNLREWFADFFDFELVHESTPEIHITVKGNETIAVYKYNGEIKRAVAKCSPDDKFDFGIGAKLALERLGVLPVTPSEPVKPSGSPKPLKYKTGDRVIVEESNIENEHSYKGYVGRIISIDSGYSYPYLIRMETEPRKGAKIYCKVKDYAPKEPKEVPHATKMKFTFSGKSAGICGTPTEFKDVDGEPLFLGDVVTTIAYNGDEFPNDSVVQNKSGAFIMGIQCLCNDGKITGGWKVKKTRSYKDVKPGTVLNNIKYI